MTARSGSWCTAAQAKLHFETRCRGSGARDERDVPENQDVLATAMGLANAVFTGIMFG